MSNLVQLFQAFGEDAALREQYKSDPDAVLERFGCSEKEKSAMRSNDISQVRNLIQESDGDFIVAPEDFIVAPE